MADLLDLCRQRRGDHYGRGSANIAAQHCAADLLKELEAELLDSGDHDGIIITIDDFTKSLSTVLRSPFPDDERILADQINRVARTFRHAAGDFTVTDTETWDALARMELACLEVEVFAAIDRDPGLAGPE